MIDTLDHGHVLIKHRASFHQLSDGGLRNGLVNVRQLPRGVFNLVSDFHAFTLLQIATGCKLFVKLLSGIESFLNLEHDRLSVSWA